MLDFPKLVLRQLPAARASETAAAVQRNPAALHDLVGWVDARVLALLRCLLALTALGILAFGPHPSVMDEGLRLLPVVVYCVYSIAVLLGGGDAVVSQRWVHWTDVALYTWLLAATTAGNALLIHFYLFAIFVAGFVHGYAEGLRVTAAAVACVLGAAGVYAGLGRDVNAALLQAAYLAAVGSIIACMGGFELQLRRRLRFLHEVNNVWSPRFGVERTIALNLDRMVRFFAADAVLLLLSDDSRPGCYAMYMATPRTAGTVPAASELGEVAARPFLELDDRDSVRYVPPRLLSRIGDELLALGGRDRGEATFRGKACERLVNVLDARSFISVPYAQNAGIRGRIFVVSTRGEFSRADLESLREISHSVSMVLENSRLMEQLIADATEHERYKISRDLHDGTIQPYIGLKIGLQALYREAVGDGSSLAPRIRDLVEMTAETITDLRTYTANLREGSGLPGNGLLSAVSDQVERYQRFFGLDFAVECRLTREITGELAAELFHFLVEGMSNVFKHTRSKKGLLHISSDGANVIVRVANEIPRGFRPQPFMPRSIAERVKSLGGELEVHAESDGHTVVSAKIPA